MIPGRQTDLPSMTAVWLLPVVSTIVAASTGAVVADYLPTPQLSLWTIIGSYILRSSVILMLRMHWVIEKLTYFFLASYILWGLGILFSMIILAVYFKRLALYKLPPKAMIVSTCIPLGPMGQGGFV